MATPQMAIHVILFRRIIWSVKFFPQIHYGLVRRFILAVPTE
jgi:hypothetical protein